MIVEILGQPVYQDMTATDRMTVKDLIDILKMLPKDAIVIDPPKLVVKA